jgi:DNA-binding transcriptional LysR family regulator
MEALAEIAVFVRVVEAGSFTAAAERLKLSKSVVSRHVTRLEDRLGARLLNRTTRRLSLTDVGRVFYERSRRGLSEVEEARLEVARLEESPRGTLRVNVPMSFGILHVAPALPDFLEQYPQLAVTMELDDRKVDLVAEAFDVAIRISDLPDSSLVARRLGPCRHVVCAAPEYLERRGRPRKPEDLRDHNVITYPYQESAKEWHFIGPDDAPVAVRVGGSLEVTNSLALRAALLGGAGVTRTPTFVVGADLAAGALVPLLTEYRTLEVSIYAVYPQRRHLSPKVRAFVDFIAARIADPPYWDRARAR